MLYPSQHLKFFQKNSQILSLIKARGLFLLESHFLLESLQKSKASGKSSSIVVIAEGDKIGKNVFELKDYVEANLPEYDVRVSVLGHMQRGGSPSCFDRVLASRLGVKAVESLLEGKSSYMVGLHNDKVSLTPLVQAIKGKTVVDRELLRVSEIMST